MKTGGGAYPPCSLAERASRSAVVRAVLTRTLDTPRRARRFPRGAENCTRGARAPRAGLRNRVPGNSCGPLHREHIKFAFNRLPVLLWASNVERQNHTHFRS